MTRRIGVLSDTHGYLRPEVEELLKGCDVILHAGDIDKQSVVERLKELGTLYVVRGNADKEWAEDLPKELSLSLYGVKLYMVHNKKDISDKAEDADYVICGHSHRYEERARGEQILLNPGSCGKRRFSQPITMAVIEVEEDGKSRVVRHDIAGEKGVSLEGSAADKAEIIKRVVKEFDRGVSLDSIAKKCGISGELTEQICRMYSTHPGIDVDGILDRITPTHSC